MDQSITATASATQPVEACHRTGIPGDSLLEASPEAAAQALDSIGGAIGILEAHPFIGRRVDQ